MLSSRGNASPVPDGIKSLTKQYCFDCHDSESMKGNLDLTQLVHEDLGAHSDEWEKVVRKLRSRQMPPLGKDRPDEVSYEKAQQLLASSLDRFAARHPNPGRTETFRRLNRTEFQNAVRDLLGVEIDAGALLPRDDASLGFDNVTVGTLSPTLLNRYITAAEKISRIAIGSMPRNPGGDTFRLRPDLTQEDHVEGLPMGTRGGALFRYTFPRDGEYEIAIRLTRDRNEEVEGLHQSHDLEVLLDRERVQSFTVSPPKSGGGYEHVDDHLKARFTVAGGPHQLGVTFIKQSSSLIETKRQPYQAHYNMHRHPRQTPAIYQVSINGPYKSTGPGDTPSRKRIFVRYPESPWEDGQCAASIISTLARRAYRRPVTSEDLASPMKFYREAHASGGFEAGIESALSSILVSPEFLFRVESDPPRLAKGAVYQVNDLALASRLSFFLWSSIPDDELLSIAESGKLYQPRILDKQVRRMLADPRSRSLVDNFAGQWLHLRNLDAFSPDLRLFPDFDDNLRQAMRRETELHFETILRGDRSVMELLKPDHTFLNERLAKHYGIPNIHGSQFRSISLGADSERGGLLRQGSVLTVTSYATRTSPVIRGNWILGNLLGMALPPPPANVPTLKENTISDSLPIRQRLSEHRNNAACAGCHSLMDPVGFSLENFDAIGRWRPSEDGLPIDARGSLPDGGQFEGVAGLESEILHHPDWFVDTLTEKLLTFALGRGIETSDASAVRQIVRDARAHGYAFSSIVLGIVNSSPFTRRKAL